MHYKIAKFEAISAGKNAPTIFSMTQSRHSTTSHSLPRRNARDYLCV